MMDALDPDGFPLGPALAFLQRLWSLNHALERVSNRMTKKIGVTAQQRFVIRYVGTYPGITPGQLAAVLHLDPGTVSATLRRLEGKRLLVRRRDPADSRRVVLGLTRKGRALDVPTPGTVEEAVAELLAGCAKEEAVVVSALVDRLTELLEKKAGS